MRLTYVFVACMLNVIPASAYNKSTENRDLTIDSQHYQSQATNMTYNKIDRGCKLIVPDAVLERMEPEEEPLIVRVTIADLRLMDAPNKGGSFGVQLR